jgi:hypothetical protein
VHLTTSQTNLNVCGSHSLHPYRNRSFLLSRLQLLWDWKNEIVTFWTVQYGPSVTENTYTSCPGLWQLLTTRGRRHIIKQVWDKSSNAWSLTVGIPSQLNKHVRVETVRSVSHFARRGRTQRKETFNCGKYRQWLNFAKECLDIPVKFWRNILFSGKWSKITLTKSQH